MAFGSAGSAGNIDFRVLRDIDIYKARVRKSMLLALLALLLTTFPNKTVVF